MACHSFYVRRIPPLEISGVEEVWPVERKEEEGTAEADGLLLLDFFE